MAVNHQAICDERYKALQNYRAAVTVEGVAAWGLPQLKLYQKLIDGAYTAFCESHSTLLVPDMDTKAVKTYAEAKQKAEKLYIEMYVCIEDQLVALQPPAPAAPAHVAPAEQQVICVEARKDPRVGTFNGTPQDWLSFRDLFMAEVVNRQDIPAVNKLRYLQEACIQKAADALGPWERTEQNFEPAWKMLQERYDDEFPIRQGLVQKIFALPATHTESFDGLSHAINVVQGALRQLNAMNVPTADWDPVIIHILTQRLPPLTMDTFEQRRATGDIPTLKALLDFVQGRARGRMYIDQTEDTQAIDGKSASTEQRSAAAQASQGKNRPFKKARNDNGGKPLQERNHPVTASGTNTYPPCKKCQGSHALYRCPEFLAIAQKKRAELIDLWGHCRNCMRQHAAGACLLSGCSRCPGEMHNQVLCPQGKFANAQVNHIQPGKAKKRPHHQPLE